MPKKTKLKDVHLSLDPLDFKAIEDACRIRMGWALPDYESSVQGVLIAEICRGWMEMLNIKKKPKE